MNEIVFVVQTNASALRIDWTDSGESLLLPAFSYDGYLVAGIGYSSCSGWKARVDRDRGFELVALFADGTESNLGSSRLRIDEHEATVPVELAQPYASDVMTRREHVRSELEPRELDIDVLGMLAPWFALGGLFALFGATYCIPARARIARRRSSDSADHVLSSS